MRNSTRVIALLTMMAIASVYLAYSGYTSTPEYSLVQARKAFEHRDPVAFRKYVDMERVAGNIYEQMMKVSDEGKQYYDWELVEQQTGNALVAHMKPRIVEATSRQLADYLRMGRFDEDEIVKAGDPDFSLLAAWAEYCGTDTSFDGIEYIEKQGSFARAGLKLTRTDTGASFVLDLVMENRAGRWRVTEVGNFSEYLKRDFELEANRLAKRDLLIAEAMQDVLVVENIEKATTPGGFGLGKSVIIKADLRNRVRDQIDEYTVEVICFSKDGEELGRFTIDGMEDIEAGQTGKGSYYKFINTHIPAERRLYDTPQSGMEITARVRYVKFVDTRTMRLASLK